MGADPIRADEAFNIPCWRKAMETEYEALMKNQTWSLVPYCGKKLIDSKWIFRTKFTANGRVERHKAHLVAKGFHQDIGMNV